MTMKFRELVHPGANYEFVGKARFYVTISIIAVIASIAMLPINAAVRGSMLNWTIDFKGGTEIILSFQKPVVAGEVRKVLTEAGLPNVDVSTYAMEGRTGYIVRTPAYGAVKTDQGDKVEEAFEKQFADRSVLKASWTGDTFYVRTEKPLTPDEMGAFLGAQGLEMRIADDRPKEAVARTWATPEEGTSEYNYQVPVAGLDRLVEKALAGKVDPQVRIHEVSGVGAKAGKELRNDGIMSMLYAIGLIMLYVAFRFDFRYGPGTIAALVHDAILVVGVFAITWTEFSLTTVAAVLTVIGYSMNDTIVVFDRIRENESKLKDKRLDRVINISINETLSRTLLTSITTFVTTLAMNLLGTGLVKNFAFAMNIGIVVGTYSSIFIAAPIMLWLNEKYFSKRPVTTRGGGRPAEATP